MLVMSSSSTVIDDDAKIKAETKTKVQLLIHKLLVHQVIRSTYEYAQQQLDSYRRRILDNDRIWDLLMDGCTAQQIGSYVANRKTLQRVLRVLIGDIRDVGLALGAQRAAEQFRIAKRKHSDAEQVALLEDICRKIDPKQGSESNAHSTAQKQICSFPQINHSPLFAAVADEVKEGGVLYDDPIWHESFKSKSRKIRITWHVQLQDSLDAINTVFEAACRDVNWSEEVTLDAILLAELPDVVDFLQTRAAAKRNVALAQGPHLTPEAQNDVVGIHPKAAQALAGQGRALRHEVLHLYTSLANAAWKDEQLDRAQLCFAKLFLAGTSSVEMLIQRADVQRLSDMPEESQKTLTIALRTLDILDMQPAGSVVWDDVIAEPLAARLRQKHPLLARPLPGEEFDRWHMLVNGHRTSSRTFLPHLKRSKLNELRRQAFVKRADIYARELQELGGYDGQHDSKYDHEGLTDDERKSLQSRRLHCLLARIDDLESAINLAPSLHLIAHRQYGVVKLDLSVQRESRHGGILSLSQVFV